MSRKGIRIRVDVGDCLIDLTTAIPVGLIVNELATNAIKHAFPGGGGDVRISVRREGEWCRLSVEDDGVGLPAGIDPGAPRSVGFQIVRALVPQVEGTLGIERPGKGTRFALRFRCPV